MTTQREVERVLDSFFAPNGDEVADWVIDAALSEVEHTPQRRVIDVPWRPRQMNPFARLAVAAAAIVIVAGGALYLFTPGNQGVGGPPAASPSPSVPSPSSAPSPSPAPSASWQTVSSERFGYSVQIPGTWAVSTLADDLPDTLYPGQESEYGDRWDEPVVKVPWLVVAVRDPSPEETLDAWMARYTADLERDCTTSEPVATEIDGVPGTVRSVTCLPGMAAFEALVGYEGRAYVITVAGSSQQGEAIQATFDRILASFEFAGS